MVVKTAQKGKIFIKVIKTGIDSAVRSTGGPKKFLYFSKIVECIMPDGTIMRLYSQANEDIDKTRYCDQLIYPDEMQERAFEALNPHLNGSDRERYRLGCLFMTCDVYYVNPEAFKKGHPIVSK